MFLLPRKYLFLLHLEHNTFYVGLSYFSPFYKLFWMLCWDLVCILSPYKTMYPQTCRLEGHLGIIKHTGLKSWLPPVLLINAESESVHCRRTYGSLQGRTVDLFHTNPFFFFFNKFIYLFIFGCTGSSLLCGLSVVAASRGYSSLPCVGFSPQWLLLLRSTGFRRAGFSSCGLRAQ